MTAERLYEGKAKIIYATDDPKQVSQKFKDDATAFDGRKKGQIEHKGVRNATISAHLFKVVEAAGVPTQLIEQTADDTLLTHRLEMYPVEVVVRTFAAGSIVKRLGFEEGIEFSQPMVEYFLKDDSLGDPLITCAHIDELGLATAEERSHLKELALKVNEALSSFFAERGIMLVDFKLEFGKDQDGVVRLGDEISPDTCRLWDAETRKKLDKDRFRQDLGGVEDAYAEILERVKS